MKTKTFYFTLIFTCLAAVTVGQTSPTEHSYGDITLYLHQNAGVMCGYGSSSFEGKGASAGFHSDYSFSLLPELQMHQKKE